MGRGRDLSPEVRSIVERFRRESGIDRVIVFGSRAAGGATEQSDVDLVLVDDRFRGKRAFERPVGLRRYWPEGVAVDFLCYTPEEFEELKDRPTIVRLAVEEGVEVAG